MKRTYCCGRPVVIAHGSGRREDGTWPKRGGGQRRKSGGMSKSRSVGFLSFDVGVHQALKGLPILDVGRGDEYHR
jgi:hypothetical protein